MDDKIRNLIEIQGGYTSYVDLGLELFDDSQNVLRMSRYRPIASHRQAFEKLAQSLKVKDERCYLLTGAYGTGKSHLCLMFANYLRSPAGEKPMPDFFAHYQEADPHAAEDLRSKRTKGRYLVALCSWGGRGDFEEIVLRAVDEALRREGFGDDFDTHYLQAIKKINEWESLEKEGDGRGRFMQEFKAALESLSPRQTLSGFKKRLKEFDYSAIEEFKRIHQAITTAPFAFDKADLIGILTNTLASAKFKERYLGLLVLFDEFGDTMEKGNLSPKMFQKFAQFAAETPPQCARLIFVGTAHKALTDYAKAYNAIDFRTASDRIKEVPLTPNGVEDIISAIVRVDKEHALWKNHVAASGHIFEKFVKECVSLKLFDWLKAPRILSNIIENIYPMHPMATYALLALARDVASNNRSVFTFFAGDLGGVNAPGSYGEFIAEEPVEVNRKLNLYTADRLFDYFSSALSSDNRDLRETLREIVKDYESSLRELNRLAAENMDVKLLQSDPLVDRLLRLILINEIIQIPNKYDNLAFGLYCTTVGEQGELRNRLQALASCGVLYFVKEASAYEFRKSKSINLDHLVEEYKKNPDNQPTDIVAELNIHVPLVRDEQFLDAKNYNLVYGEDKRLRRQLVRPSDLASDGYFDTLESSLDKYVDYQGYALYTVCETLEDIQRAKNLCARNKSERIVVAVPKNPVPLLDAVMDVRALKDIEGRKEAENFSTQDKSTLNGRLYGDSKQKGALAILKELRDKLLSHRETAWYGKNANGLPVDANQPFDAANIVMDKLFGEKRNKFSHDDFNKVMASVDKNKNIALKEAIEEILDLSEHIVVDTGFAQQRGDIRYLQRCLLTNGVLIQTKADGTKLRCDFQRDVTKFSNKLPALAAMLREIEALEENQKLQLGEFFERYRRFYGQGNISLAISLACIRRYFGDSIIIKSDDTSIIGMQLRDFETIVNIVQDRRYPQAFLSYRLLRGEERALANKVFEIFTDSDTSAARNISLQDAYNALKFWWDTLPPLAHISKLYPSEQFPFVVDFLGVMESIASEDPHNFILDELPKVFGDGEGLAITRDTVKRLEKELPKVKEAVQSAEDQVRERIFAAIQEMFGSKQKVNSSIIEAISKWYGGLDSNQQDHLASWHTNESKPLVIYLKKIDNNLSEVFLERIPASPDYGLRRVTEWVVDHTDEYIERLDRGKQLIEDNRLKVEPPEVIPTGKCQRQDNQILFHDRVTLLIKPKKPGDRLFIVEGNADPTEPSSNAEEHKGEARFEIKDRKTIRYAVRDADGNWSQPQTLELINETKKYEIAVQHSYRKEDSIASFVFPSDEDSLEVSIRSLLRIAMQLKLANVQQIKKLLKSLIDEM